ncbi:MAG TPA: hypothetical protein VIH53_05115 [Gemmatimonadaceae bacterium]
MTTSRKSSPKIGDLERPHPLAIESLGDEAQPITVRLADLWSDLVRAGEGRDPESPRKSGTAVPILDEMKGILQWD